MCNNHSKELNNKISEYINIQTGEKLDLERITTLPDNVMLKVNPHLWIEWDFEKNNELGIDIWKVTKSSTKKVWWLGTCGHEWETTPDIRNKSSKCPYCTSRKILIGYNDMWTTNSELASLLLNPEDGYKYMQNSHQKVDWKCQCCGNAIKNKKISDINIYGLSCNRCCDGMSFPEKVMREILLINNIDFIYDTPFEWSFGKKYDFYLPIYNTIIEIHGKQHFNGGFKTLGGLSLEDEINNDKFKYDLAVDKVERYIVVDAMNSDIIYIKNNIINTELKNIVDLNNIDWSLIHKIANKSINYQCLYLWNNGYKDINIISKKLNLHIEMVRRYLKQWSSLGECDFNTIDNSKNIILQLDNNNNIIKEWNSVKDISLHFFGNKNKTMPIDRVLLGYDESFMGYIWKYKSGKRKNSTNKKNVVQLTTNGEFIKVYDSITIAVLENNIPSTSHVTSCCKGRKNIAYGYKWMYLEDYEKQSDKAS